jgi:hypothetical protein
VRARDRAPRLGDDGWLLEDPPKAEPVELDELPALGVGTPDKLLCDAPGALEELPPKPEPERDDRELPKALDPSESSL